MSEGGIPPPPAAAAARIRRRVDDTGSRQRFAVAITKALNRLYDRENTPTLRLVHSHLGVRETRQQAGGRRMRRKT